MGVVGWKVVVADIFEGRRGRTGRGGGKGRRSRQPGEGSGGRAATREGIAGAKVLIPSEDGGGGG